MEKTVRLNKYLSDAGICSRREADRLIEAGKVTVDGETASMGMQILPGQTVVCDGKRVGGKEKPVFLAVHKPRGIVCTTSDKDRAENIVEFLHYPQRIYPVGRLDKDSEGLLLMTNQGEIVNKILRAGNGHEKEYAVAVNKPVTEEFMEKLCAGVWLEELEVTTKPCKAWKTGSHTFHIILTQGLNRQIRRMCRALDYHVMNLKRLRIMNIKLGTLKRGEYRELTAEELAGLLERVRESTNQPAKEAGKRAPEQKEGSAEPRKSISEPGKRVFEPKKSGAKPGKPAYEPKKSGVEPGKPASNPPKRTASPARTAPPAERKPAGRKPAAGSEIWKKR